MSLSLRFLNPRATCLLCGREVDPEGAIVIEKTGGGSMESSCHGTDLHADYMPGELLVICARCEGK